MSPPSRRTALSITWNDTCDVFITYGEDSCRGLLEVEENTVDETLSPV